jgi:hypothetical protein
MSRFAHRHRDRQRLQFRIGRFDDRKVGHAAVDLSRDIRLRQPVMPLPGRRRRAHRLRHQHVATLRRRRRQNFDIASLEAETIEQRLHRVLRVVRGGPRGEPALRVPDATDCLPGLLVEIGIEPRQHHGAVLQGGHHGQEFRGRRHRAGRARCDDRPFMMRGQPDGFRFDQAVAPVRRLDPADLLEMIGPRLARDAQEIQRVLPVFVELVRHQAVERFPGDATGDHVVHQPRQIAGQRQRRCRAADHQRRQHRAFRPRRYQMSQRQPAFEFAEPWRKVQRRDAAEWLGAFGERQFVFVDIAKRDNARQDGCARIQFVEKDFPRQPAGASGRQVQRRPREVQGILACLKSLHQPAVDQRSNHGAQERRGNGNAENAHGLPDSRSGQYREVLGTGHGWRGQPFPIHTVVTREGG